MNKSSVSKGKEFAADETLQYLEGLGAYLPRKSGFQRLNPSHILRSCANKIIKNGIKKQISP